MFDLPYARKEFPCKNKRKDGPGLCDQIIYKDKDGLVKNISDGRGGIRGKRHICPDRVGTKFHHFSELDKKKVEYSLRHKLCSECLNEYDSIRCPLCPTCFKLECSKCGTLRTWINNERLIVRKLDQGQDVISYTIVEDIMKPKIDNELCKVCGDRGMSVRQVWNSYQRLYGKYEFE